MNKSFNIDHLNTSEGRTAIYVNEIRRNVVGGRTDTHSNIEICSNYDLELPKSENITNSAVQKVKKQHRKLSKDSTQMLNTQLLNDSRNTLIHNRNSSTAVALLKKLESLRTPSSRTFKHILQNHCRFDYQNCEINEESKSNEKLSNSTFENHGSIQKIFPVVKDDYEEDRVIQTTYFEQNNRVKNASFQKLNKHHARDDSEDTVTYEHYNNTTK